MPDDVILNKAAIIERCVARIQDVYGNHETSLLKDFTKQDSLILNLQRACEASIDLAIHVVRKRGLGIPQESWEAFDLLRTAGLIDQEIADGMKRMVEFRNVAVHEYTNLNLDLVKMIITQRLGDFSTFSKKIILLGE